MSTHLAVIYLTMNKIDSLFFLSTKTERKKEMTTRVKSTRFVSLLVCLLSVCDVLFAGKSDVERETRVEIKCEEVEMKITVKRQFFEEKHIPFRPENLRLGANLTQEKSCGSKGPTGSDMVLSAGLRACGTESSVRGEWLVYSNQLLLFPATSTGLIARGTPTVIIPVECHYKRKRMVNGEPLTPTWQPMTSTISAFGLLHFSLRTMTDECSSPRSSSVYQQGEAVFLEAGVEAPLHPPLALYVDHCVATLKLDPLSSPSYKFITKHGCLMDSVLPGSSSKFLPRKQDNRLCFSVHSFRFNQESGGQMFISCHIRATLKRDARSRLDKACSFHKPTFSWCATEGDSAPCGCCDSDDCFTHTGHTTQPDTAKKHEGDATVGPLHTLPRSHWTGRLSVDL